MRPEKPTRTRQANSRKASSSVDVRLIERLKPLRIADRVRIILKLEKQYHAAYPETMHPGRRKAGVRTAKGFSEWLAEETDRSPNSIRADLALGHGLTAKQLEAMDNKRLDVLQARRLSRKARRR